MKKRARVAEPKKEEEEEEEEEEKSDSNDYISQLPDDILVSILHFLTLKEAASTSKLSRRWRYLWTYTSRLDFDSNVRSDSSWSWGRPKYINWVNRVVRQHRGPILSTLRIYFDLDKSSKSAIDNWVKFAFGKRVQVLELDLLENRETYREPSRDYTFPHMQLMSRSKGPSVYSNIPRMQPCVLTGMKCLQVLSLKSVRLGEETLECLLSCFPALQSLSISNTGGLRNVKVRGSSIKLKYLGIAFCYGIECIEISNVNLVSFLYLGRSIDLIIRNVPMLDEICIGQGFSGVGNNVFGQLSCCLCQLEILTLDIYRPVEGAYSFVFPEIPKLKQLILKVGAWDDDCLLDFTSLIQACPNLNKFVLQLIWMSPLKRRRKIRQAAKHKLRFLKEVAIIGYYGRTSDAEIALYFIENATALQKVLIDPRDQTIDESLVGVYQIKKEEAARKSAKKQLEAKTPPGVQLIIL